MRLCASEIANYNFEHCTSFLHTPLPYNYALKRTDLDSLIVIFLSMYGCSLATMVTVLLDQCISILSCVSSTVAKANFAASLHDCSIRLFCALILFVTKLYF